VSCFWDLNLEAGRVAGLMRKIKGTHVHQSFRRMHQSKVLGSVQQKASSKLGICKSRGHGSEHLLCLDGDVVVLEFRGVALIRLVSPEILDV
jgi:hypothetical protein